MNAPNPLSFTQTWRDLGIVDDEQVAASEFEWEHGDDKNAEHFRYGAFRRFLDAQRPLSPEMCRALYELGNDDPDEAMGGAIMAKIITLKECPPDIIEDALCSPRPLLKRLAEKRFPNIKE